MKDELKGLWVGQRVVCMASGPSLHADDVDKVRDSGLRTIVVNTTYTIAPWADALYAMDTAWWAVHARDVTLFRGMKLCAAQAAERHGAKFISGTGAVKAAGNSGAGAIVLAAHMGASEIILLGYDCKKADDGRVHWHGDHPKGLTNGSSLLRWPAQMQKAGAEAMRTVKRIINCSRDTALTCFERAPLEAVLC